METTIWNLLFTVGLASHTVVSYRSEPECACSKFHYEEQLLEKMIRTEINFQDLQEKINAKLSEFKGWLEDIALGMNKTLELYKESNEEFVERSSALLQDKTDKAEKAIKIVEDKAKSLQNIMFRSQKTDGGSLTLTYSKPIVFEEVEYNFGSGYNNSTGEFSAPVEGTYLFIAHLCPNSAKYIHYKIVVDGEDILKGFFRERQDTICTSFQAITSLKVNQKVSVQSYSSGDQIYANSNLWNMFSGVLLQ